MSKFFYTLNPGNKLQYTGRIVTTNPDGSGTHMKFSNRDGSENGPYKHSAAEFAAMTLFDSEAELERAFFIRLAAERVVEHQQEHERLRAVQVAADALVAALNQAECDRWLCTEASIPDFNILPEQINKMALVTSDILFATFEIKEQQQ